MPPLEAGASCPLSPKTKVDLGIEGVRALPGRGLRGRQLDGPHLLRFEVGGLLRQR
jgi:hypothetical protein